METCNAVLTFKSEHEILWCDHSNETSSAVLLHGIICFPIFCKIKFGIFPEFSCLALLGVEVLNPTCNRYNDHPIIGVPKERFNF